MSIEFRDSFAHYDTTSFDSTQGGKWTTRPTANASFGTGRWGSPSKCLVLSQNAVFAEKVLTAQQTRIVQVAVLPQSLAENVFICQLYDGAVKHVEFIITTAGEVQVKRGDGTQLAITSGLGLVAGFWRYFECKAKIDNSAGEVYVWVDGVSKISSTGLDTQNAGNASSDRFRLASIASNTASRSTSFGDLVVVNTSGSAPYNDHLGEVRVECIFPDANGTTTNFTPSTGTNHAALLDESAPNGDTDYVQSNTLGHIDLVNLGALSSSSGATILEVTPWLWAKRTDATARSISVGVKDTSSGTPSWGSAEALSTGYQYYSRPMTANPVTAAIWTYSEVNALEAGIKVEV